MNAKTWCTLLVLVASTAIANAIDFGGHVGYYGSDVKKADVGVNVMIPFGIIALAPNIDYTRSDEAGLWFAGADVALRFQSKSGPSYWIGAGPTYGYVSNYESGTEGYGRRPGIVRGQQYPPGTNPPTTGTTPDRHSAFAKFGGTESAWGWDVNTGVSWSGSSLRPYLVGRYNQVRDLKTAGVAVGIRFGR